MVKVFKDGERLTAVFYDCSPQTQKLLVQMIKAAGEEVPEQTIKPPHVMPAKEDKTNKVIYTDLGKMKEKTYDESLKLPSTMAYSGMTVKDALKKDGLNALIQISSGLELHLLDKNKDKILLDTIQKEFHDFAVADFNKRMKLIEQTDLEEMRDYIMTLDYLLPEITKEILEKQTYESIDVFALSASTKEIKQAYASLAKALSQKY